MKLWQSVWNKRKQTPRTRSSSTGLHTHMQSGRTEMSTFWGVFLVHNGPGWGHFYVVWRFCKVLPHWSPISPDNMCGAVLLGLNPSCPGTPLIGRGRIWSQNFGKRWFKLPQNVGRTRPYRPPLWKVYHPRNNGIASDALFFLYQYFGTLLDHSEHFMNIVPLVLELSRAVYIPIRKHHHGCISRAIERSGSCTLAESYQKHTTEQELSSPKHTKLCFISSLKL